MVADLQLNNGRIGMNENKLQKKLKNMKREISTLQQKIKLQKTRLEIKDKQLARAREQIQKLTAVNRA
ncbi:unnamed protein product [marine sediment metagenome]|uniref:Uncharacterized protein n=1 Tax=marine sediment metagenome TaxID=412755 RepID=X1SJ68_9ZZZZ